MATKPKAKFTSSLFGDDDLLDSLFDDEKQPPRSKGNRSRPLNPSSDADNLFSKLAEEVKRDGLDFEDSDVSAADASDILKNMENIDDMEADLFASKKKPSSAPSQTKSLNERPKKDDSAVLEYKANPEGADLDDPLNDLLDDLLPDETKQESKPRPNKPIKSAPSTSASASPSLKNDTKNPPKKGLMSFNDDDDDLIGTLGFDGDKAKLKENETPLWSSKEKSDAPRRPRTKIDDILEGFSSTRPPEQPSLGERKEQLPAQEKQEKSPAVKEEDLTFGSYQPTLGSTLEGRQSRRQSVRFSTEDISTSTPEKKSKLTAPTSSRHRNSADWLGLKTNSEPDFVEDGPKAAKTLSDSPKAPSSPLLERKPSSSGSQMSSAAKIATDIQTETKQAKPEFSKGQRKAEEEEEGDDWLSRALSKKKTTLSTSNIESKTSKQEKEDEEWLAGALSRKKMLKTEAETSEQRDSSCPGDKVELESAISIQDGSKIPRSKEDTLLSIKGTSPDAHSTPIREERPKQDPNNFPLTPPQSPHTANTPALSLPHPSDGPAQLTASLPESSASISYLQPQSQPPHFSSMKESGALTEPSQASGVTLQQPALPSALPAVHPGTLWHPHQSQTRTNSAAVQQQVAFPAASEQKLQLQQQMWQPRLLDGGAAAAAEHQPGDYQALQARIIQLEGQIKILQLERDQSQMMLENIQQRHKQDMELMESTHKARVKLLEESAAQRETRARLECEDLMERMATLTRSAEEERSVLQAQYHRKVAQAQEDRDREVERLRELQRKSILEMKKEHEDQLQRLKRLKDEEIDAVTSAVSQTRSLTGVIEQMEQFSSRLGELSSRVESTHEHTAHGLEQGAWHRDEQLRTMQDRLAQQQKAAAEERAYLKEIISRMDVQLGEQQRQIEKERWKVTAEQAKAESIQRSLEEERRVLTMQISMEREELERAKSLLLEEQKSVMQHCADERRKLAAEWAHFHAQEKQRHERAERDVSSLLEKREGSIITLAQEQADLKLRTAELKQKEMTVAQERETLERLREELEREKERISSTAVRLKTRAQEVEAFSKLAAEKYEEGERALQEAKRVEAEHEVRLKNIHTQTEHLRLQEQRILKERMRLNHLQEDKEKLRQGSSVSLLPQIIPPDLPDSVSVLPIPELTTTLDAPPIRSLANSQSMALQASLALWKYTAEKDHEFLQEEQIFLENLKKKSFRFNTD